MEIKVILTGATGMVGEGVLFACLEHPAVKQVLMLNRRSYPMQHPKLKECIVPDFMKLEAVKDQLRGYDACFFCAGISSIGMKEPEYRHITYDITMNLARTLAELNPDMIFDYVSGASTDSSEKGRMMWARVKGKTENDLMKLPFKRVYNFRPGFMKPTAGQTRVNKYYKYVSWLYPIMRGIAPNSASSIREVGIAMINTVLKGYPEQILEVKDINRLAKE
jgi:uncharacterized protein YbjT (DUF2867 family)